MLRHRYSIGLHNGYCNNSFPFRLWIIRYVPLISFKMSFDDILVVAVSFFSFVGHNSILFIGLKNVLTALCSASPFRGRSCNVGAYRNGVSRSRNRRTCQVHASRQSPLRFAFNCSSLVARVRRFTNSRNIFGIVSSQRQTILSILTSILFNIIGLYYAAFIRSRIRLAFLFTRSMMRS